MENPKETQPNNLTVPERILEEDFIEPVSFKNIEGLVEVTTVKPIHKPRKLEQSLKVWIDGSTRKLCIFDYTNSSWYSVSLTLIT